MKDLIITDIREQIPDSFDPACTVYFTDPYIRLEIYDDRYEWYKQSKEDSASWHCHCEFGPAIVLYNHYSPTFCGHVQYALHGVTPLPKEEWNKRLIEYGYVDKDDNDILTELI